MVFEECGLLARSLEPGAGVVAQKLLPVVGGPLLHFHPDLVAKGLRAVRVGGVWPQGGADHCPACGEGAARPPDVQGRDVAVSDGLLASRMI